jgi:F420-dependent oxidoreductase-like protein
MKLGIHNANFTLPVGTAELGTTLAATARAAEQAGASMFTLMDHFFQIQGIGEATEPMLEGYTALGFLAGQTTSMDLGLMVTGVTYRHPGLLAKTVTTLDVLSGGRAVFGVGAAWFEREHLGLGVPFPPVAERFERLEETLQICAQMWSDNDGPYQGKHYQLAETLCVPRPIRQPGPKVLIGGGGERKTLRMVAQYADACNLFAIDPATVSHKIDVLNRHCDDVGRDPAAIQKTIMARDPLRNVDKFLSLMEEYAKLGVDLVEVMPPAPDPVAYVTEMGEKLVPRLAEL